MNWATALIMIGTLSYNLLGQQKGDVSLKATRRPVTTVSQTGARSKFDFDEFVITKTGLLTIKGRTNQFLLIPEERYPGELRSVTVLDFDDHVYVARFGEPGGIGVEGFYDICFQFKDGKILADAFELAGSLERFTDKVYVRSSAYIYDRLDKKVFRIKYGETMMPLPVAMTNALNRYPGN